MNHEPDIRGCARESFGEADERTPVRPFPTPDERCGELHRISGANTISIRQLLRETANSLGWLNLVPRLPKLLEQLDRPDPFRVGQGAVAHQAGERAAGFDWRAPPDDQTLHFAQQPAASGRRGLRTA